MPRRSKGPRLWLRPARRDGAGRVTHAESYFILDRGRQIGVGNVALDEAERALANYIAEKRRTAAGSGGPRKLESILVGEVLDLYGRDVVPHHARPVETERRLLRVLAFFGEKSLADINGPLCREYVRKQNTPAMARRDLEELRAAINHHLKEGLHDRIVKVVMPDRGLPRERWLDRSEAARLLWALWRRPRCKHMAKFMLVALYTGRRASVICQGSYAREPGRTWFDVVNGRLHPPERTRVTKKRNPPIWLPEKLLIHMRAWHRNGDRYVVQWGGHPVKRIQTLTDVAAEIGLGSDVTPHVLRHTATTWQMRAGTDILEAGRYLGMTARTLETVYAHHRPEHLAGARDAFKRMPRQRFAKENSEPTANKR